MPSPTAPIPGSRGRASRPAAATSAPPPCPRNARTVIAEPDPSFIRPCGEEARIHVSRVDCLVEGRPVDLSRVQFPPIPEEEARAAEVIGAYTAGLVQDGDTLQV